MSLGAAAVGSDTGDSASTHWSHRGRAPPGHGTVPAGPTGRKFRVRSRLARPPIIRSDSAPRRRMIPSDLY
eukprot:766947-Hanusia_phi.AAC.3